MLESSSRDATTPRISHRPTVSAGAKETPPISPPATTVGEASSQKPSKAPESMPTTPHEMCVEGVGGETQRRKRGRPRKDAAGGNARATTSGRKRGRPRKMQAAPNQDGGT
jgi:hypothetical protein